MRVVIAVALAAFPVAVAAQTQTTGPIEQLEPIASNVPLPVPAISPSPAKSPEAVHTTDASGALLWSAETDPFRRCAMKALAGLYGTLRPWQKAAYEWGLARGVRCCGVAKVTAYGHKWEPAWLAGGTKTACGSRVHLGGCASNPQIPFGTLLWTPYGLRYVTDRGGWVKVGYARVHGRMRRVTNARETANIDYYTWGPLPTLRNAPYAIVKRDTDRGTWFRPMSVHGESAP